MEVRVTGSPATNHPVTQDVKSSLWMVFVVPTTSALCTKLGTRSHNSTVQGVTTSALLDKRDVTTIYW